MKFKSNEEATASSEALTTFTDFDATVSLSTQPDVPLDSQSSEASEATNLAFEEAARAVWAIIVQSDGFMEKYGRDPLNLDVVHCFAFNRQPRADTFCFEAFAAVRSTSIMMEEMVFHPKFEQVIEKNTKSRAKPNPVLMETRSTDFCYRLTILVEAVPQIRWLARPNLRLRREFAVLTFVWEKFSKDLASNNCPPDFLVGIPMPFEFVNVVGHPQYDFKELQIHGLWYNGLHGEEMPMAKVTVPGSTSLMRSSLSYMCVEKLGPTVSYLLDLMKHQRRMFSLSSALKIFDQLLCRLMVLHRFGVVLGNVDPKFLNFGVREATKVLYISRFDCATVVPSKNRASGPFSERYASLASLRRREVHFVNDIESAFYLFLSLIFSVLPWDGAKFTPTDRAASKEIIPTSPASAKSTGLLVDEKVSFWASSALFVRMLHHLNFEFASNVYHGFTTDILGSLYTKTQEAMNHCEPIAHAKYMSLLLSPSSPPNNAYSSIRRVIATYFRFEHVSNISKDPTCHKKIELLLKEDPIDRRLLWNLNDWCWNPLYPNYGSIPRISCFSPRPSS